MPKPPNLVKASVERAVATLARDPFEALLVNFIRAAPSQKAVKAFAEKYPDRWSQALTIMAKLRGYTERVEHDVTINIMTRLHAMGDAELVARRDALLSQIIDPHQLFLKAPIEGQAEPEEPS